MKWILVVVGTTMVLGIHSKRSRDKEVEDHSKIMEEYLLRTFDGGSRKDGGVEGIIEVEENNLVKKDDEIIDSMKNIVEEDITPVGRLDTDIIAEVGSGETNESEAEDDVSGDDVGEGGSVNVVEEGSGGEEEEQIVVDSAPYSMVSLDGETTVNIILQRLSGSDILNMVCDVATDNTELFKESDCVPEIYMVSGVASCSRHHVDLGDTIRLFEEL